MEYLTEIAYQRWHRQYFVNLKLCLELLDQLRIRLEALPVKEDIPAIENRIQEIDEELERVIPRNFDINGEPLTDLEKFCENSKVLVNLICRMTGKGDKFRGIYQAEKEKILKLHQQYHFKEQLRDIRTRIEMIEETSVDPRTYQAVI